MPAADPGFHCCEDAGHSRDCYLLAEVERLRAALEEIRDTAQFTDECNIASMAEDALRTTAALPK